MTKERRPQADPPAFDPVPPSVNAHETATFGSPPAETEPGGTPPRKKINPWRFGFHTVPPGMQATLLAKPLPETPKDRLYRPPGPLPDSGESAAPLATDELPLPKRDFRRPVALALFVLLLVVGLALFRSSRAPGEGVSAQPSASQLGSAQPAPEHAAEPMKPADPGLLAASASERFAAPPATAGQVDGSPRKGEGASSKQAVTHSRSSVAAPPTGAREPAALPSAAAPPSVVLFPSED